MNSIIDYFVPAHDPLLGIKTTNLVACLDAENWQSKALSKGPGHSRYYIYLCQATCARERKRYYCVNTYSIECAVTVSQRLFLTLSEALAFANQDAATCLLAG